MANKERPDEVAAKAVVEAETGYTLRHWDTNGQADYLIKSDGQTSGVLEVSRFTTKAGKENERVWAKQKPQPSTQLTYSWSLTVEGHPKLRDLPERVQPALYVLEEFRVERFVTGVLSFEILATPRLQQAYQDLLNIGVTGGHRHALEDTPTQTPARVHFSRQGGYVSVRYEGNALVEAVSTYIGGATARDNLRKLREADGPQRHLFLWVDTETPGHLTRALRSGGLDTGAKFIFPPDSPDLPEEVTHLWIVDEPTGLGWYWDGQVWAWVTATRR